MNNNALESYNNELYNLLSRRAHPNPYFLIFTLRKALEITQKRLAWVESGDFVEVKSRDAIKVAMKRQRLKKQYVERLNRCKNEFERRRARLRYMKITGSTSSKIVKGRGKKIRKVTEQNNQSRRTGRPSYRREKASQEKKCRLCGKTLLSKSGCKNHERVCRSRGEAGKDMRCKHCGKHYQVMFYLIEHEQKCKKRKPFKKVSSKRVRNIAAHLAKDKSSSSSAESQIERHISGSGEEDESFRLRSEEDNECGLQPESMQKASVQLECHICTKEISKSDLRDNVTLCDCDVDNTDFVHINCQFANICPFT